MYFPRTPFFSIVIPTYNRNESLRQCLECLKPGAQSLDISFYEVVITDDGTTLSAEALIDEKYPWVIYTKGPKRGPAANRNHGAKQTTGKWVVFTDDDCLPSSNWLEAYFCAIKDNHSVFAYEGTILPHDRQQLQKDMAECPVNETGGLFWSANVVISKPLFERTRGFTELFPIAANEDQELSFRLKQITPIIFCADAIVVHPVRFVTLADKIKRLPDSERSQIFLRSLEGYSGVRNYFDGIRIHFYAAINEAKKFHFKRVVYNLVGLIFRLIAGAFLIHNTQLHNRQRYLPDETQ